MSLFVALELSTEVKNRSFQDLNTVIKLIDGHDFSGALRDANVSGPEHDRVGAKRDHAGGFGAEGDSAGRSAGSLLKKIGERRVRWCFEALVRTSGIDLADKVGVFFLQPSCCAPYQIQNTV